MPQMTIGRLARAAGAHVETIRYYQRRGLLESPRRPPGGVRRYGDAALARLRFIKRAQAIGFTLEEIRELLRLERAPGCREARTLAAVKLAAVRARIADLEGMRSALERLVAQCDSGRARSCPIIDSLADRA
jgi:MerR family transcriptional regulator, mercuric resistance operon regulatory protein